MAAASDARGRYRPGASTAPVEPLSPGRLVNSMWPEVQALFWFDMISQWSSGFAALHFFVRVLFYELCYYAVPLSWTCS